MNDMNRDEFLTLAVMHTPGWGETSEECADVPIEAFWHHFQGEKTLRGYGYIINEKEYLQRRAELINEPDDKDAPEWAKWKAQDASGRWHWYSGKPTASDKQWDSPEAIKSSLLGQVTIGHDWSRTLKAVSLDKTPDDAWDGETWPPPVGSVIEVVHFTTWEKATVVAHVTGHTGRKAVWQLIGFNEWSASHKEAIRPPRTPEQRAEEAMASLMAEDFNCTIQDCIAPAERIYTAIRDGKVPGVRLETDKTRP